MKPLGLKPDGHAYDEAAPTRTREKHAVVRHERRAEEGNEIDDAPFCEACGGPCTGLGPFIAEVPPLPSGDIRTTDTKGKVE